jgi:hypothetical protein
MLKVRLDAAKAVAEDFMPAEAAVEEAFQRVVSLLNTMCKARVAANLPMQTGRREFDHISSALHHIGEARSQILCAHEALVETRGQVLPTISFGDNGSCPPGSAGFAIGSTPMRVVG